MGESGDGATTAQMHGVDDMTHLRRFLCFGSEMGRCNIEDKKLTVEKAACIMRLIEAGQGEEVVQEIVTFSQEGRAAKQKALIFALAICARLTSDRDDEHQLKTKRAAYAALDQVCRIPTDLFHFVKLSEKLTKNGKGWGRLAKKAISLWYTGKQPKHLAYLVTKYISREGWSHTDLLRLVHLKTDNEALSAVLKYVTKGLKATKERYEKETGSEEIKELLAYLSAVDKLKQSTDEQEAAHLIREHKLVREHIPTWLYNKKEVWCALLEHMPISALLRNLGKLSALDLLSAGLPQSKFVIEQLANKEALKKARIHPLNILLSREAYKRGKSEHAEMTWQKNPEIVQALEKAFNQCFENIVPTNKRFLLSLDITKSMRFGEVAGCRHVPPVTAAAAMTLMTSRVEKQCDVISFAVEAKELSLTSDMQLEDITKLMSALPKGEVDCAIPIQWALSNKKPYDVFVIFTDYEPFTRQENLSQVLRNYREQMEIPDARLVVCGLASSNFSIADPNDKYMLDVAGLDASTPLLIQQFVNGLI